MKIHGPLKTKNTTIKSYILEINPLNLCLITCRFSSEYIHCQIATIAMRYSEKSFRLTKKHDRKAQYHISLKFNKKHRKTEDVSIQDILNIITKIDQNHVTLEPEKNIVYSTYNLHEYYPATIGVNLLRSFTNNPKKHFDEKTGLWFLKNPKIFNIPIVFAHKENEKWVEVGIIKPNEKEIPKTPEELYLYFTKNHETPITRDLILKEENLYAPIQSIEKEKISVKSLATLPADIRAYQTSDAMKKDKKQFEIFKEIFKTQIENKLFKKEPTIINPGEYAQYSRFKRESGFQNNSEDYYLIPENILCEKLDQNRSIGSQYLEYKYPNNNIKLNSKCIEEDAQYITYKDKYVGYDDIKFATTSHDIMDLYGKLEDKTFEKILASNPYRIQYE